MSLRERHVLPLNLCPPCPYPQEYGCRALQKLASQEQRGESAATSEALMRGLLPLIIGAVREHASAPGVLLQGALAVAQVVAQKPNLRAAAREAGADGLCAALERSAAALEGKGGSDGGGGMGPRLQAALRKLQGVL